MKLLPYRKYRIEIRQSKFEFKNHLTKVLEVDNNIKRSFFKVNETTFNGVIHNDSFKMYKYGFGNTSLIPILKGKVLNLNSKKK